MLLLCPGARLIASCGCVHNRLPQYLRRPRRPRWSRDRQPAILYHTVSVLNSTKVLLAQVAISNILATNATANTGPHLAIFVPKAESPIFVPKAESPTNGPWLPSSTASLPTPVRAHRLLHLLNGYDPSTADFLVSGFLRGFSINFKGSISETVSKNLSSALEQPDVVDVKLTKEIEASRIAGPFDRVPFPEFRVSPLGVVPKKSPGEFRLIHHLSYPKGFSINDGIDPEYTRVTYATIEDAIRYIKKLGPGCFLAKTDIKSAFRIIPIHPSEYYLLGMVWNDLYYYDRCMPMGCASSCRTFETFSTAVEWIARKKLNIDLILHLLDDFLLIAPSKDIGSKQLDLFLQMCSYLGIPIAPEKTFGPATTLSFAGIELDTIRSEARLPQDKIEKCTALISDFLRRKKVSLKEIQSLTGLLNFACSVVKPGRAFLRRLIDLSIGLRSVHHFIRITREVKQDLQLWLSFLSQFNGKSFFLDDLWLTSSKLNLVTDASGALGFGAIFGNQWCNGEWPDSWKHRNIAILEFYPIVLSLYLWGHEIKNRCILFFTDNEALVYVINKQSCRDKDLMFFVRKLVLICLRNNILFRAKHVPGSRNNLADALSRLQVQTFRRLAPLHMDRCATDIPLHLQPQNWQP